jgi:AraC-like DNA-binding protein
MEPDVIDPGIAHLDDERLRREAWIDTVAPIWTATPDLSAPHPWQASFRAWKVGGVHLYKTHSSPQTVERTRSQVATLAVDHVYLQQHVTGHSSVEVASDEQAITSGTIVLVDLAQPVFGRSTTSVDGIGLCVPRRLFDARVGEIGRLHRSTFERTASPLSRLLSDHMRNMQDCLDASDAGRKALLSTATVSLLNAMLTPVTDSAYNGQAVAAVEIRQFIEANLGRADLGVGMLCARFGLSRTPVYALFESDGGVMTYVRNRRLARAMRMLSGVEGSAPTRISSVAYACGYENLKSFSKAFHARYGVNPRDVDAGHRDGARQERGEALLSWMKEL